MAHDFRNVGGTRGGLGTFVLGLVMSAAGAYLLSNQVTVHSGYWSFFGQQSFGLTLLPMLIGVALLFFNGKSIIGWLLTLGGAVFILMGILVNLNIHYRSTSLYNTLLMLVLLFGGLGLIFRSLRPMGASPQGTGP